MDQFEVMIIPRGFEDYSRPWWTLGSLKDSPTAYPVSGDDIARWRAERVDIDPPRP